MPHSNSAALSFRWEGDGRRCWLDVDLTDCRISPSIAGGFGRCSVQAAGKFGADIGISYLKRIVRRGARLPATLIIDADGQRICLVGHFSIDLREASQSGTLWSIGLSDDAARISAAEADAQTAA